MKHYKRINEVFNEPITDGIFSYLLENTLPFEPFVDKELLNADYHGNNSGLKIISPLVELILSDKETLSTEDKEKLGKLILKKYKDNWTHIWNTYFETVYEPLENYNRTEEYSGTDDTKITPNLTTDETQTPNNWTSKETKKPTDWKETQTESSESWKETETQTPTDWKDTQIESSTDWKETETQRPEGWRTTTDSPEASNTSKTDEKIFGFNSSTPVPSNSSNSSSSQHSETTQDGTFTTEKAKTGSIKTETSKSGSFKTEKERTGGLKTETSQTGTYETETTQSGTFSTKREEKGNKDISIQYGKKLRVKGNIGVTTSQQMMESELELRKYDFFQQVYNDIDKVLTINVY